MLCTIHCSLDLVLHSVRLVMRYKKESNISTHQCSLWVLYFGLLSNDLLTIVLGFLYVFIGIFADKAGSSNNETNKASKCCSLIWGSSLSFSLHSCMWAYSLCVHMHVGWSYISQHDFGIKVVVIIVLLLHLLLLLIIFIIVWFVAVYINPDFVSFLKFSFLKECRWKMLNSFIFLRFYFKIFFFLFLFSGNGEQDKDIHCFRVCYWGRALWQNCTSGILCSFIFSLLL